MISVFHYILSLWRGLTEYTGVYIIFNSEKNGTVIFEPMTRQQYRSSRESVA